jgi:hypothetical protein
MLLWSEEPVWGTVLDALPTVIAEEGKLKWLSYK